MGNWWDSREPEFLGGRETAHLLSTLATGLVSSTDSSQVIPRHPQAPAYRCFLPDLAEFTGLRRVGPGFQYRYMEI